MGNMDIGISWLGGPCILNAISFISFYKTLFHFSHATWPHFGKNFKPPKPFFFNYQVLQPASEELLIPAHCQVPIWQRSVNGPVCRMSDFPASQGWLRQYCWAAAQIWGLQIHMFLWQLRDALSLFTSHSLDGASLAFRHAGETWPNRWNSWGKHTPGIQLGEECEGLICNPDIPGWAHHVPFCCSVTPLPWLESPGFAKNPPK